MKRHRLIRSLALTAILLILAAVILYVIVLPALLFMPPRHKEIALHKITNRVAAFTFNIGNEWDVSFDPHFSDKKNLATQVECRLRNVGRNEVVILHDEEKVHLPNYGDVLPGREITLFKGELGAMLEGTIIRVGGTKSSRVTIEIRFATLEELNTPIVVHLDEQLQTL